MVHAPMPVPTMPDFSKSFQPSSASSSSSSTSDSSYKFDPFSPPLKSSASLSKERIPEPEKIEDPIPLKKKERVPNKSFYDNTYHGYNKDDLPIM